MWAVNEVRTDESPIGGTGEFAPGTGCDSRLARGPAKAELRKRLSEFHSGSRDGRASLLVIVKQGEETSRGEGGWGQESALACGRHTPEISVALSTAQRFASKGMRTRLSVGRQTCAGSNRELA